jgi:wyosine [tRNA(Phe)-imidazoG37] synthetase (radical SAM superfamily)
MLQTVDRTLAPGGGPTLAPKLANMAPVRMLRSRGPVSYYIVSCGTIVPAILESSISYLGPIMERVHLNSG